MTPDVQETGDELRRVHRLSPLLRAWTVLLALVAVALFNFTDSLLDFVKGRDFGVGTFFATGAVLVVSALIIFAVSQLWWSRIGFRVGEEEIEERHGLLTRQVRTARYDRIQAVDVVEPLAPRLLGLAAVRIEVAGGFDSAIDISYLPRKEAEQVKVEVLRASAGRGADADTVDETMLEETTAEPDYLIAPIPIARSLFAALLRGGTLAGLGATTIPLWTGLSPTAMIPVLIGVIPSIWGMIDQSWRFSSTVSEQGSDSDTVDLGYGLANRRRQTIPVQRIHAVKISQPVLWRFFGWWSVTVTVAGYGSEASQSSGTSKLLPVGNYQQAMDVLEAVSPLHRNEVGILDESTPEPDYRSPARARWVSPLDWSRQAVALYPAAAVVTFGRVTRKYCITKISHIQELSCRQGPLQRWRGLSSVRFDLVPGSVEVTARDLDSRDAYELVNTLRTRALPEFARQE